MTPDPESYDSPIETPGSAQVIEAQVHEPPQGPSREPFEPHVVHSPSGSWFTIAEAVEATNSSRSTIKRRLAENAFPQARQSDGSEGRIPGAWLISKMDLLEAGFRLYAPAPANPGQAIGNGFVNLGREPDDEGAVNRPRPWPMGEVIGLRHQVAVEQVKREAAERLAAEKDRRIDDLRQAMRMLEAGPLPTPRRPRAEPAQPKRRWWGKK